MMEENTLNALIIETKFKNLIGFVTTYDNAIIHCNRLRLDISDIKFHSDDSPSIQAFGKLQIITRALNEGWKPNRSDVNELKYYNYFYMNNGAFSCFSTHYIISYVDLPSALFFKSRELAKYAGRAFIEIYKDYYNN
jgi:hypothetical protein